jgi:hypothetical protein
MNSKKVSKKFPLSKSTIILIIVGIFIISAKLITKENSGDGSTKIEAKSAISTQNINQEFSFPLKDQHGGEIGTIKYMIEKAELRDEIIVKGQRATAAPGRAFIILSIKITNDFKQAVQVNTRDYVRLSVNNDTKELLAPEIHNDPVEVQAISTKSTKVGFPINTTDHDIILWVGELNAEKERIAITL